MNGLCFTNGLEVHVLFGVISTSSEQMFTGLALANKVRNQEV